MNRRSFLSVLCAPAFAPVAKLLPKPKPSIVKMLGEKMRQACLRMNQILAQNVYANQPFVMKYRQLGTTQVATALLQWREKFYE